MIKNNTFIHPDSKISKSTIIEPFSYVDEDVKIGKNCWIGNNVTIYSGANHVKIFPGAVISAIPQDLKFNNEKSTVEIDDHTTIRECVTISRGTIDKLTTKIGKKCLIMAYSHIAHDCIVKDNVIMANMSTLGGHVEIQEYASLGGGVLVHQFCKIGSHVFIGGGFRAVQDVPPYILAVGEPL